MVDALKGTLPDSHWDLLAVEEAYDGRQEEVHVVVESAAKLLQRRQELASHLPIGAGVKQFVIFIFMFLSPIKGFNREY